MITRPTNLNPTELVYRQGDLDGLCGIYAIINAYRLLFGEHFSRERGLKMFMKLARSAPLAVFDGLKYRELLDMLVLANAMVPVAMRLEVRTQVFRKPADGPALRVDTFVRQLRQEINEQNQVAILGLERAHDHWTLLHKITPATFKLSDSQSLKNLRLTQVGLGNTRRSYRVVPSQIILLRPWKGSPNDLHPVRRRLAKLAKL